MTYALPWTNQSIIDTAEMEYILPEIIEIFYLELQGDTQAMEDILDNIVEDGIAPGVTFTTGEYAGITNHYRNVVDIAGRAIRATVQHDLVNTIEHLDLLNVQIVSDSLLLLDYG